MTRMGAALAAAIVCALLQTSQSDADKIYAAATSKTPAVDLKPWIGRTITVTGALDATVDDPPFTSPIAVNSAKGTHVAVSCDAPPKVLPAGVAKGQTVVITGKVAGAVKHSLTEGVLGLWLMALAPPVMFEAPVVRVDLRECEVTLAGR